MTEPPSDNSDRGDDAVSPELRPGLGVLLSRGALPAVAGMFLLGLAVTIFQLSRNHQILVERTALQHAKVYSDTLRKFRGLYNSEVVEKVREQAPNVKITHDYLTEPNAIPLPITLSRTLQESIALPATETKVYSPFPFPWRVADGGLKDEFARDAWKALNDDPEEPFYRIESYNGVRSLRYAQAERMEDGCVTCHNEYADSPKTDWHEGDVRGVLEVVYPIEQAESLAEGSVWETLGILSPMLLLALAMLGLTNDQYRRWSQSLESRVRAQQRTHVALQKNKARYRRVLETAPDFIMIADRQGIIEFVNRTNDQHYVTPREGSSAFDHLTRKDADAMRDAMERALATGEVCSFDTSIVTPEEERWFKSRVTPLGSGEDDKVLIFSTDVTSEHLARHALEENADLRSRIDAQTRELLRSRMELLSNQRRLIQVLESLPLGVLVLNPEGHTEYANDNAVELLGDRVFSSIWSGGRGDAAFETTSGEPYPIDELPSVKALRGETGTVMDLVLADELPTPLLVSGAPIFDEDGEVSLAIVAIQDITEQKRLERQADQAHRMQAVGRLAGGVAHDFNNLLTAIVSFGAFALRKIGPEHPGYRDVEQILAAATRGESLTAQLLAFSRHRPQNAQIVAVNDVIESVDAMLRRLLPVNVELEIGVGEGIPNVKLEIDALDQVVVNLAVNARDAMPDGGKIRIETAQESIDEEFATRNELSLDPGEYVRISVYDEGGGMSPETLRHMFDPFFTTKGPGRGTGLGLATCWGVVQKAGGAIRAESAPGEGTVVHVYLPGTPEDATPDTTQRLSPARGGTERVVVAEDDDSVRELLVQALGDAGYRVLEAADGDEAYDICEVSQPGSIDLLLTDVLMPGRTGPELAKAVGPMQPRMRVMYISGYFDETSLSAEEGAFELLQKPFTPEVLLRRVREVLDAAAADADGQGAEA